MTAAVDLAVFAFKNSIFRCDCCDKTVILVRHIHGLADTDDRKNDVVKNNEKQQLRPKRRSLTASVSLSHYHYHRERSAIAMSLKSGFSMALLMSLKLDFSMASQSVAMKSESDRM